MEQSTEHFEKKLLDTFILSEKNRVFSSSDFFGNWFKESGTSYFFLFKKNLQVTNIQFAELLSLLKTHIKPKNGYAGIHELQFVSKSEFSKTVQSIIDSLSFSQQDIERKYKLVYTLYSPLLRRVVVIDTFFGSCAVYLPPHLSIDAAAICAQSGYIHSCGPNVFIRNMNKVTKPEFYDALDKYLVRSRTVGTRVFFAVYAHEDFTIFEREKAAELRGGLDDAKVYVEKLYMGPERLVSVLKEMKEKYKDTLEIPDPGNFKTVHREFRGHANVDLSRTIWLIQDRSIGDNPKHAGDINYLIVYDQEFLNENPFHFFDENKPAWVDHTTIPHTLTGAMINITRPWSVRTNPVILADPFVGSGTVWLESLKFSNVVPTCGDISPISILLTEDNLRFFALSPDELDDAVRKLRSLSDNLKSVKFTPSSFSPSEDPKLDKSYAWTIDFLSRLEARRQAHNSEEISFTPQDASELLTRSYFDRLLFYVGLRTNRRNVAAFARQSKDWITAYVFELSILTSQIDELCNLRRKELNNKNLAELDGLAIVLQGNYSLTTTLGFSRIKSSLEKLEDYAIKVQDVRTLQSNSCDLIITDPPYGFNTGEEIEELATLYESMVRLMISALRDDGHLVFCLPDQSRTGRQLPFFTQKGLIIQQVLAVAEECQREVINSVYSVPNPTALFRPPYYWESERALRRSILHFRIRLLK